MDIDIEFPEGPIETLDILQAPVFLLWGELDPWITPASADKIMKIFPAAKRVDIRGGHCEYLLFPLQTTQGYLLCSQCEWHLLLYQAILLYY